jgi:hypothetical protein
VSRQYCLEGVAMITPDNPVSAYAMVFRTGAVEFVSPLIEPDAAWIEDIIFGAWRQFFDFAKKFNVEPPILVFATLIEVAGVKFSTRLSVSFRTLNGGAGLKMTSSNAMYQTSRDRFGNYVPVIAVDILSGVNWELAEIEVSGVWIFNNRGRFSKCLPQ